MKNLLLFLFMACLFPVFSQDYKVINKVSNRCYTIFDGQHFGLLYDGTIVQKMEFSEYDYGDGLIVFNRELASVCWNNRGEEVLRFNDANMSLTEDNNYLIARKNGKDALYSRTGKQIVPFGSYEFDFYAEGVLIKDSIGQQAYFSDLGNEILPFSDKKIEVLDDYEDILAVKNNDVMRVYLGHNMMILPSSFSPFSDYTFASDHEVTVEEYLYFLGSQQNTGYIMNSDNTQTVDLPYLLPDTTRIEPKLLPLYRYVFPLLTGDNYTDNKTKVKLPTGTADLYMPFKLKKSMKKLAKFPVTGITKEQAEMYCNWLNMVCEEYSGYYTFDSYADFRLPTAAEWEKIASDGMDVDCRRNGIPDSLNEKGCMMFIYNSTAQCENYPGYLKASGGGGSISSQSGPVDNEDRYHVFGNVAEMVDENGTAKGGSYAHSAKSANMKSDIQYTNPEPWLGFRIVGEYHY